MYHTRSAASQNDSPLPLSYKSSNLHGEANTPVPPHPPSFSRPVVMNSTLNCLGWMQNQNDQSPCTTAQEVGQLCIPEYTVFPIDFQESQYIPSGVTANGCTCSWSIYNLLSACSYCVGQSQYTSWDIWTTSCGSYVSNNSYLPSGLRIPQGIPFWAATNPSTWDNATFNVTEAANIAETVHSDVTGEPLPTTTATVFSSSHVSVGAVLGGVIGGIAVLIFGGLFVIFVVCYRRKRRMHTTRGYGPSFDCPEPVSPPMIQNQTPVQSSLFGHSHEPSTSNTPYLISPFHSTTSLAPRMLRVPSIAPRFLNEYSAATAVADSADMVSPFVSTSPSCQANRSNPSALTLKTAEAFTERVLIPPRAPGQRARLNPPPYSTSGEVGSSMGEELVRRQQRKKGRRRKGSMSRVTGSASVPTKESVVTVYAGTRMEKGSPGTMTGTVTAVESNGSGNDVDHLEDGTWHRNEM